MTPIEFVARTFSPQLQDGRFVFRPWGARGPCYLLSQHQRAKRAWIQLGYYGLAIAAIWSVDDITATTDGLVAFAVAFALLNYVLFWLFSIGLPTTEKPSSPTPQQRRIALAAHSRALGRPMLWVFAIIAWLFALTGAVMAMFLQEWFWGLVGLFFFAVCAAIFTWQLWLIRETGDK